MIFTNSLIEHFFEPRIFVQSIVISLLCRSSRWSFADLLGEAPLISQMEPLERFDMSRYEQVCEGFDGFDVDFTVAFAYQDSQMASPEGSAKLHLGGRQSRP